MGVGLGAGAPLVAVVDYHKGNLLSVERGLLAAGARPLVTDDPAAILAADALVVPGVGAFDDAMAYMVPSGQARAVLDAVAAGKPLLGICLGMQLLFDRGDECAGYPRPTPQTPRTDGLGLIPGEAVYMEAAGVKVPHMGWNSIELTDAGRSCPLLEGVPDGSYYYFTHSYVCVPAQEGAVAARTVHAAPFTSVAWDGGTVFGTQFHPEKSSAAGEVVMGNFVRIARNL